MYITEFETGINCYTCMKWCYDYAKLERHKMQIMQFSCRKWCLYI